MWIFLVVRNRNAIGPVSVTFVPSFLALFAAVLLVLCESLLAPSCMSRSYFSTSIPLMHASFPTPLLATCKQHMSISSEKEPNSDAMTGTQNALKSSRRRPLSRPNGPFSTRCTSASRNASDVRCGRCRMHWKLWKTGELWRPHK